MATVPEAASTLGVSERFVRMLLQRGTLAGRRLGKSWEVDEQDLRRLLSERLRRPLALAAGQGAAGAVEGPLGVPTAVLDAGRECSCGSQERVAQLEEQVVRLTLVVAELADLLGQEHEAQSEG